MIGQIEGILIKIIEKQGLIATKSGISFWVQLPTSVIANYQLNTPIKLFTYLKISENELTLYGFSNFEDYHLFKMLLLVDTVGPKTAHNIISFASSEKIIQAVENNDLIFFQNIPGIGKKTAAKIVLELNSRLKKDFKIDLINLSEENKLLFDTLKQLGFQSKEIAQIMPKIPSKKSFEEKLKFALQLLGNERK